MIAGSVVSPLANLFSRAGSAPVGILGDVVRLTCRERDRGDRAIVEGERGAFGRVGIAKARGRERSSTAVVQPHRSAQQAWVEHVKGIDGDRLKKKPGRSAYRQMSQSGHRNRTVVNIRYVPVLALFAMLCRFFNMDRFCRSRPSGNLGLMQQIEGKGALYEMRESLGAGFRARTRRSSDRRGVVSSVD